jgi:hypothetical protein
LGFEPTLSMIIVKSIKNQLLTKKNGGAKKQDKRAMRALETDLPFLYT